MDRMGVLYRTKDFIEKHLAETHNLQMAQLPLILSKIGGVNDLLTCDGSGTPVEFPAGPGLENELKPRGFRTQPNGYGWRLNNLTAHPEKGINTDTHVVRKGYLLNHVHSSYIDQWDWEKLLFPTSEISTI